VSGMGAKEVSRRDSLRLGTAAGLAGAVLQILASCGKELPKVKSGKAISGPADEPLAKLDVKVANGSIIYA
jgi:hypothetical protein